MASNLLPEPRVQGQLKKSLDSNNIRQKSAGKMSAFSGRITPGDVEANERDPLRPKCGCLAMGPCTAPPRPQKPEKLGREKPLRIATIFLKGDEKRQLFEGPGLETTHLNPQENLVQQWESLENSGQCPDLLATKLNRAISHQVEGSDDSQALANYIELRNKLSSVIKDVEVTPFHAQISLCNRTKMEAAITHVCRAVNDCFDVTPPPRQSLLRFTVSKTSPSDAADAAAAAASEEAETVAATDPKASVTERGPSSSNQKHPACVRPASILIERMRITKGEEEEEEELPEKEAKVDENINKVDEGIENELDQFFNESKIVVTMFNVLPFPLVVKATDTSIKAKAIVFDAGGLAHFRQSIESDIIAEQYVAHGSNIIKLYNIGESVLVIERPSLPDISPDLPPSPNDLEDIRRDINGEIVHIEAHSIGQGDDEVDDKALKSSDYITFDSESLTKRHSDSPFRFGCLHEEQFSHLDQELLKSLAEKFRHHVGHPFFGINVIISSADGLYNVIDINAIPDFKGLKNPEGLIRNYLLEEAKRRALEADCRSLRPADVIEMALAFNDEWRKRHVTPNHLKVRHLTMDRVFEVNFVSEGTRKEVRCRNTLVKLYSRGKSKSEAEGALNIYGEMSERGIIPTGRQSLSTRYFDDADTEVGFVQPWISAKPLQILLIKEPLDLPVDIWRQLGAFIARSHESASIDQMVQPNQKPPKESVQQQQLTTGEQELDVKTPMENGVLEKLVQEAVAAFASTTKRDSTMWKPLFDKLLSAHLSMSSLKDIVSGLTNPNDSKRVVFGNAAVDILANIQVVLGLQQQEQQSPKEEMETEITAGDASDTTDVTDVADNSSITDKVEPSLVLHDVKTLIDPDEVERGIVGPNFVGVCLANILINLAVLKARKLTRSLEKEEEEPVEAMLVRVAKEIATGYLEATRMTEDGEEGGGGRVENVNQTSESNRASESSRKEQEKLPEEPSVAFELRINSFVDDILKLVPLVALMHACSCIQRASAQGQLRGSEDTLGDVVEDDSQDDDDGIIRRKDRKFNWLRHARDHLSVYEDHISYNAKRASEQGAQGNKNKGVKTGQ